MASEEHVVRAMWTLIYIVLGIVFIAAVMFGVNDGALWHKVVKNSILANHEVIFTEVKFDRENNEYVATLESGQIAYFDRLGVMKSKGRFSSDEEGIDAEKSIEKVAHLKLVKVGTDDK